MTEFVSGVDLVKEQIRVAAGLPLSVSQGDSQLRGHAIECRINAEDPGEILCPVPEPLRILHLPGGNGVRMDTAVYNGYHIPPNYDSMIVKVIVHDKDRPSAIRKMQSVLGEWLLTACRRTLIFSMRF